MQLNGLNTPTVKQATSGAKGQTCHEISNRKKYQTAIALTANKINLKLE